MVVPSKLVADGKNIQDANVASLCQLTINLDVFVEELLDALAHGLLVLFML